MAGVPFAGDRGRDNRPGASPTDGGLFCDTGKEPNPGAGAGIPAGLYSAEYPMATLAKGQNVRWRWPAKNHANTPSAGTVEVYISSTPNTGDTFSPTSPIIGQMSYSSDGGDCLGLGTSTDTADCQGTWQVPTTLQEGRYTVMWWWEFNTGEFYNTCADVFITAAEGDGAGDGTTPIGGASPPPPPGGGVAAPGNPAIERSVVKVIMTVVGEVSDFGAQRQSIMAQSFADITGVPAADIVVTASEGYGVSAAGDGSVDVTVDIRTASEAAALTLQNVLSSEFSTAAEASLLLAGAQVTVLRVQAVERVLPSQIATAAATLEGERDGWRTSTLAMLALVIALPLLYVYNAKKGKDQGATASDLAKKAPEVAYEVNPAKAQIVTPAPPGRGPPAQVALPPGWFAHVDPSSGHTYYINQAGESTWNHPGLAALSPV